MTDSASHQLTGTASANGRWHDNAAYWIQIMRERRDRYRTELTDAVVYDAIGSCDGIEVLDVGCGEGYMAREIARRGARRVIGVDKEPALVEAANAAVQDDAPISFKVGDVNRLELDTNAFDVVVANHVLNDLEDVKAPIHEFARVLRPSGRLVILMLHPCFYGRRAERQALRRNLAVDEYFS